MQNASDDVKKAVRQQSKKELWEESQGVCFLLRNERDGADLRNKRRLIRLYIHIDDRMTRNKYIANWPIVSEYVRQLKQSQGFWNDGAGRFFEMLEAKRVASRGKIGYAKLAELINRRIERQIRAKQRNEVVAALNVYTKKTDKENMEEAIRRGYDTSVHHEDARDLLGYFDFSEDKIKEITCGAEKAITEGKAPDFAVGRHSYTGPITTAQVRTKLLTYRRLLSR